ncbi:hypothetical protein FRB99_007452 [Tulasnella sp. 403]|nr:hypothetical protein FRB99_007452 [Tulasnella sp. 403]
MLPIKTLKTALLTLALAFTPAYTLEDTPDSLVPLRTHSIYAPYVDQDLQNRWFDFGGEAYVNTNKHIRLTQDRQSETGWLWSRLPITVNNYQIDIEFKAGVRRNDIKTKMRIIYKKDSGLQVKLQYKGWDEWTPCFEIKNATLPTTPYLGVTAITGEVHDAHDVISISTSSIVIARPSLYTAPPKGSKGRLSEAEGEGTWGGFFLKLILLAGVCSGAYYGYTMYYVRGGGAWSNKRF